MPRDREPRGYREQHERNGEEGERDRAGRETRQGDTTLAQRIEGELRSGGEPDQRDGAVADEPKGVDFLAPHQAQPRGPNGETDQQVTRESRQPRALREFAADDRGEQQKSERQGRARFERPARSHAMKDGHHQAQHEQRRDRPYGAHGPQNIRRRHAFDNALERGYLLSKPYGLRSPPHAQRVLSPRRRQPDPRIARSGPGAGHGLARPHRPRQPPRGVAVLQRGP